MIINVGEHKCTIDKTPVNELEVNVTKIQFVFSDKIPNNYVKKAFFTLGNVSKEVLILNNECDIPNEVLVNKGQVRVGVIAYEVQDDELIQRFNPSPCYFETWEGSMIDADNTEPITPTDKEQIEQAITDLQNTKQDTLVSGENIKTINNESLLGSGNLEVITDLSDYYTKEEIDNKGYINKDVDNLTNYTKTSDLSKVATSGSYNDLEDTPNLSVYSLITETGAKIDLEINSSTYVLTAKLYDKNNNLLSTSSSIDLPLETMVVGASYDSETKEIILTLKNGQEVRFSVADLVSGLQTEITPSNKLASDLVDDTNQTHKFVSQSEKTQITTNATNIAGIKNGTTINSFSGVESALNGKEDKSNKVTSISSDSTDTQYPSAKCVYDSQALQDNEISDLKSENDYLNSIINQLPKVSSQGTILTLNNTINGRMNIELGTSELEQESTTGKNLFVPISSDTKNGMTFTNNGDGSYTLNGTSTGNTSFYKTGLNYSAGTYTMCAYNPVSNNNSAFYIQVEPTGEDRRKTFTEVNATKTFTTTSNITAWSIVIPSGLTLNNFVIRPMLETGSTASDFEKYTGGIPAPNPSFPMPIHTISGNNKVVVEGSNLFDYNTCSNTGISDDNGTISTLNTRLWSSKIKVVPSQKYTFKTTAKSSNNENIIINRIIYYDKNGDFLSRDYTYTSLSEATFTIPNNTYYIVLDLRTQALTTNLTKDILSGNTQLNKGETLLPYTPYVSQEANINLGDIEYCEIGDYKDEFVRSSGKNIWNSTLTYGKAWNNSNGTQDVWSNQYARSEDFIKVKPNTTYTISFVSKDNAKTGNILSYTSNTTFIDSISLNSNLTFTTGATTEYIRFNFFNVNNYSDGDISNIMLNLGSTALPYEPYGIGNWGIRKNIGKVVLDGSESSWANMYLNNQGLGTITVNLDNFVYQSNNSGICNYFIYKWVYNNPTPCFYVYNEITIGRIMFVTPFTTKQDFINWLSTHNIIVYYILATPQYILLNDTLQSQLEYIYNQLLAYKGQTNISQINNDLPFNISASALLDLNTLVGE